MKDTKVLKVVERTKVLAASWALLVAFVLLALAVYTFSLPVFQDRIVSSLFAVCVGVLPGAAVVLIVLTARYLRPLDPPSTQEITPATPSSVTVESAAKPPPLYSLDQALGVPQLRELRAHVDLLCTMATLERMGPELTEGLKQWGVPARAQQAAISAEILQRLLSAPGLETVLHRCSLLPGTRAFDHVQTDLGAIAASLRLLGWQVQGDPPPIGFARGEIEASEALMGNMAPIDRLLLQYSDLLTGVAAMARILATSYEKVREGRFSWASERQRRTESRRVDGPTLADAMNLPRWKLN